MATPTIPSTGTFLSLVTPRLFRPWYTPNDMLKLGVFGGSFFGPNHAARILPQMNPDIFLGITDSSKWKSFNYNQDKNYFDITPAPAFENRTYNMTVETRMIHQFGWFEWYCRFYYGERSDADTGRLTQWLKEINRHFYYIKTAPYMGVGDRFLDLEFLPVRRQKLLEFGVDPTKDPASYNCNFHF